MIATHPLINEIYSVVVPVSTFLLAFLSGFGALSVGARKDARPARRWGVLLLTALASWAFVLVLWLANAPRPGFVSIDADDLLKNVTLLHGLAAALIGMLPAKYLAQRQRKRRSRKRELPQTTEPEKTETGD